ncbi:MAG: AAA family ATPase [Blautia sp.]|nr:AAA family ATPase [Blautia sp.]MDY5664127.1 AAA family ATPase [Blautia sp.]
MKGKVIAIANQKGGCAKTTTAVNLAAALTRYGKKVAIIDADPQGSCTASLGYVQPDDLKVTLANIMTDIVNEEGIDLGEGILHHKEGMDLIPANIELAGLEVALINVMSRELILKAYVEEIRYYYDYILIDCMPSLGMLTINALVAADSVIIPVQTSYLPVKGLEQLLSTISKVRRQLNKHLKVEGILLTMVDMRTVYTRDMIVKVHEIYGQDPKVGTFAGYIPRSVRAEETCSEGVSIFKYRPDCKIARAYLGVAKEVLDHDAEEETRGED